MATDAKEQSTNPFSMVLPEELYATADPADVAVLIFWRMAGRQGRQQTVEAIWEDMVDQALIDPDGKPIRLQTVQDSYDRLVARDLIPQGGESL